MENDIRDTTDTDSAQKAEGIKATINSKPFFLAFIVGAVMAFVVLQHPYFQVYIHPEAMAKIEIESCFINLRALELAYGIRSSNKREDGVPNFSLPIKEPKKLYELMSSMVGNKYLLAFPEHNSKVKRYDQCAILLPGKDRKKPGLWFCYEHGFATPPPKGVEENATPLEQLKQFGITDQELLAKCKKRGINRK